MSKTFHVLGGLPRSGSTLLANVLNQHPDVHCGSTSALGRVIGMTADVVSNAPEVKSDLINQPGAYEQYAHAMRGLIQGWFVQRDEPIVIDKSRDWVPQGLLLEQLYPSAKMILTIRDPRDVVASIERAHRRTALFNSPVARTIYESASLLMARDGGMIGSPMLHIEDLLRRNARNVIYVRYESLVRDPLTVLEKLFEDLELPEFTPNTEDVEDHATDADGLYLGKFPHHDAVGQIKATGNSWHDVIDEEIAAEIAQLFPLYMETFSYTDRNREQRRQRR